MEDGVVVVAARGEGGEVVAGAGCVLGVELYEDGALFGVVSGVVVVSGGGEENGGGVPWRFRGLRLLPLCGVGMRVVGAG